MYRSYQYGSKPLTHSGSAHASASVLQDCRFAVDSNDNILVASASSPTQIFDKVSENFSQFEWPDPQVHACDIICERVDTSILNNVFGVAHDGPAECIWVLDSAHSVVSLFHTETRRLVQITQQNTSSTPADGSALIASPRGPTLGALALPVSFVRLNRPAFVIHEGFARFRLLDIETWQLTTITNLSTQDIPPLRLYPGLPSNSFKSPFIPSDDFVFLESESELRCLDVRNGNIFVGQTTIDIDHFYYDYALPMPSSRRAPIYAIRNGSKTLLFKVTNGKIEKTEVPLETCRSAVHVASANLSLLSVIDMDTKFPERVWGHFTEAFVSPMERLPPTDLSPLLLNNDYFPHDLVIQSDSQIWKTSFDSLRRLHPYLDDRLLIEVVKPFPSESVEALITFLFNKPLPTSDWALSGRIWSHVIYMWEELAMGDNLPFLNFIDVVLPKMGNKDVCTVLCDMWNDEKANWTQTAPIIESLARHVKAHCSDEFLALLMSLPTSRNVLLAYIVPSIQLAAPKPLPDVYYGREWTLSNPPLPEKKELSRGLETMQLKLLECSDPKLLLHNPNDFVFVLNRHPQERLAMVGDKRYLYSRWEWFKRLVHVGGVESTNRIAEMPSWMTSSCLATLLACVHSGRFDEDHLTPDDALDILEHRREMDLVDAEDEPLPTFESLYESCIKLLFPKVNSKNVLSNIIRYHRIGMASTVKKNLAHIASGKYEPSVLEVFDALPMELLVMLKQMRDEEQDGSF